MAEGWDLSRPLWDMMLVDNYHDENGAVCAVVARGYVIASGHSFLSANRLHRHRHHTLSDGQGMSNFTELLQCVSDPDPPL